MASWFTKLFGAQQETPQAVAWRTAMAALGVPDTTAATVLLALPESPGRATTGELADASRLTVIDCLRTAVVLRDKGLAVVDRPEGKAKFETVVVSLTAAGQTVASKLRSHREAIELGIR